MNAENPLEHATTSTPEPVPPTTPLIHIVRHGESLHNVIRPYPHRDPPLTAAGEEATRRIRLPAVPDLIAISPMTRTIQTATSAFPSLPASTKVQIWPDLREAHDAICNRGISRAELSGYFPQFDFAECPEEWDYPPHTVEGATERAEAVRLRLRGLAGTYGNIVLVTHRGFIAFLVQGERFGVCETRSYRFGEGEEGGMARFGVNVDSGEAQDFGPTLLVPCESVTQGVCGDGTSTAVDSMAGVV